MDSERISLTFTATKEALDMVSRGEAKLDAGGIRRLDGSIFQSSNQSPTLKL